MRDVCTISDGYFEQHRINPRSGAGFMYILMTSPPHVMEQMREQMKNMPLTDKDRVHEKAIAQAESKDEIFRLMRTKMIGANRELLHRKLGEHEEDVLAIIKEHIVTTKNDAFIDNAVWFLGVCKEDCTNWIWTHLNQVDDLFLQSLLCMILGIRGDESFIPFLKEKVDYFESAFPGKGLEQGSLFGLRHMQARMAMAQQG